MFIPQVFISPTFWQRRSLSQWASHPTTTWWLVSIPRPCPIRNGWPILSWNPAVCIPNKLYFVVMVYQWGAHWHSLYHTFPKSQGIVPDYWSHTTWRHTMEQFFTAIWWWEANGWCPSMDGHLIPGFLPRSTSDHPKHACQPQPQGQYGLCTLSWIWCLQWEVVMAGFYVRGLGLESSSAFFLFILSLYVVLNDDRMKLQETLQHMGQCSSQ